MKLIEGCLVVYDGQCGCGGIVKCPCRVLTSSVTLWMCPDIDNGVARIDKDSCFYNSKHPATLMTCQDVFIVCFLINSGDSTRYRRKLFIQKILSQFGGFTSSPTLCINSHLLNGVPPFGAPELGRLIFKDAIVWIIFNPRVPAMVRVERSLDLHQ